MRPRRVSLFGIFGNGNFGNECTLEAMLCNVRRFAPDAEISCICVRPEDTSSRYNIPASLIKATLSSRWTGPCGPVLKWLRRVVVGVPMEIYRWVQAIGTMIRVDGLVMTGTGMLGDFGIGPLGLHYDILRWSVAARLCRRKLLFVSVGAGPIERPLSRWFVKAALSLAHYRSYRDGFSNAYLESIGFNPTGDAVYPDLAFSLPKALVPDSRHDERPRPVVGIGVMAYYDRRATLDQGGMTYEHYIDKLARLVVWLLEHNYTPRLLIGDVTYDDRVMLDLRRLLRLRGVHDDRGVIDEPMASHQDVLSQLAATDYVVASRFHNVLLALMLNKPVVAISYHEKINALMAGFGLQEYCQDIEHLDLDRLIGQLTALERNAAVLKPRIERTSEAHRKALDSQYQRIFNLVIRPQPSSSEHRFATSSTALSSLNQHHRPF